MRSSSEDIEGAFIQYYHHLFTSVALEGIDKSLDGKEGRVLPEMNAQLVQDLSVEEVEVAIQQMAPFKSPGLDGFPAGFYQDNWRQLKEEVCAVVSQFFNFGTLDDTVNFTHIALVPKLKNPSKMSDFRLISLYNVLYKILSKVLANQLKEVLPHIISLMQSAFIPGRLITDNILFAYEGLHTMHSQMWSKMRYMPPKTTLF